MLHLVVCCFNCGLLSLGLFGLLLFSCSFNSVVVAKCLVCLVYFISCVSLDTEYSVILVFCLCFAYDWFDFLVLGVLISLLILLFIVVFVCGLFC